MFIRKLIVVVILLLCAVPSVAAPLKVYVADFKVTGGADKEGLAAAMQSLLASRLAGENVTAVGKGENPDLTVSGTYIAFGKIFSIDAQLAEKRGNVIGRAFEQGDSADEVIPAVGRLAVKLNKEIEKSVALTVELKAAPPAIVKDEIILPAKPATPAPSVAIKAAPPVIASKNDAAVIRPEGGGGGEKSGKTMQRLDGVLIALAELKPGENGNRVYATATEKELRIYEAGTSLQLLATEKSFAENEKILALDVADLDNNGIEELYVTSSSGQNLVSRVYEIEKAKFRLVAQKLPYFFRGIALLGADKKIYAQQMSATDDFYGGLNELVKKGTGFDLKNPIKLPRFLNIYNMNMFKGHDGSSYFVSVHPDGYLAVSKENGEELWRGIEKFGGTETYFRRDDLQNTQITGSSTRQVFLEQRIIVTKDGTVIIPKNEGSLVIGTSRIYNKSSVYAFKWNGDLLEEIWHTKPAQSYLADYFYDEANKSIVTLDVIKRGSLIENGNSTILFKKVE